MRCHCWVPLQGAILVCYWLGGGVTTKFGGVDMVRLQGAIAVCYGGGVPTSGSGRGDAGCHCTVPL